MIDFYRTIEVFKKKNKNKIHVSEVNLYMFIAQVHKGFTTPNFVMGNFKIIIAMDLNIILNNNNVPYRYSTLYQVCHKLKYHLFEMLE